MKIGIMTFWWSEDNYGQILQCYALQKYLRDQGHDAYVIRFKEKSPFILLKLFDIKAIVRYLKNFFSIQHNREFSKFKKNNINFSTENYFSLKKLKRNPPQADIYIVGSDQVWNFFHQPLWRCKSQIHAYFLDFGNNKTKRISYAASWGNTVLSKPFINEIKPLLANFDYLSVREDIGIKYCNLCNRKDVAVVPDPCLLLSIEHWRMLYKKNEIKNKYLLIYIINHPIDISIESLFDWGEKESLEVKYITANSKCDGYPQIFPSLEDWLFLIDHAEYVITNSFHCSVFSILFRKQFAVIPLNKSCTDMNYRLNTLFQMYSIDQRFLEQSDFSILKTDYFPQKKFQTNTLLNILQEINF